MLSSLVRVDNELNVCSVLTLNVSKIPVEKFGTSSSLVTCSLQTLQLHDVFEFGPGCVST